MEDHRGWLRNPVRTTQESLKVPEFPVNTSKHTIVLTMVSWCEMHSATIHSIPLTKKTTTCRAKLLFFFSHCCFFLGKVDGNKTATGDPGRSQWLKCSAPREREELARGDAQPAHVRVVLRGDLRVDLGLPARLCLLRVAPVAGPSLELLSTGSLHDP